MLPKLTGSSEGFKTFVTSKKRIENAQEILVEIINQNKSPKIKNEILIRLE